MNLTMDLTTALSKVAEVSKNYVKKKIQEGAVELYIKGGTQIIKDYWFPLSLGKEYKIRMERKFYKIVVGNL